MVSNILYFIVLINLFSREYTLTFLTSNLGIGNLQIPPNYLDVTVFEYYRIIVKPIIRNNSIVLCFYCSQCCWVLDF